MLISRWRPLIQVLTYSIAERSEEILKSTKLMSCSIFGITIQAMIERFGRSTEKRIEENSKNAFRYLYRIGNKYFKYKYGYGELI